MMRLKKGFDCRLFLKILLIFFRVFHEVALIEIPDNLEMTESGWFVEKRILKTELSRKREKNTSNLREKKNYFSVRV
jgi:hypothetical protein